MTIWTFLNNICKFNLFSDVAKVWKSDANEVYNELRCPLLPLRPYVQNILTFVNTVQLQLCNGFWLFFREFLTFFSDNFSLTFSDYILDVRDVRKKLLWSLWQTIASVMDIHRYLVRFWSHLFSVNRLVKSSKMHIIAHKFQSYVKNYS